MFLVFFILFYRHISKKVEWGGGQIKEKRVVLPVFVCVDDISFAVCRLTPVQPFLFFLLLRDPSLRTYGARKPGCVTLPYTSSPRSPPPPKRRGNLRVTFLHSKRQKHTHTHERIERLLEQNDFFLLLSPWENGGQVSLSLSCSFFLASLKTIIRIRWILLKYIVHSGLCGPSVGRFSHFLPLCLSNEFHSFSFFLSFFSHR